MSRAVTSASAIITIVTFSSHPLMAEVVGPFGGPVFGLATAPNGDLLVADAGIGLIMVRNGDVTKTIVLPGVTDASSIGHGSLWAITGGGMNPRSDSGQGVHRLSPGDSRKIVNLFEFEETYNPDGNDPPDSNPFDVESLGGSAALVADAGANDLLRVDNSGEVHVLAIFPNEVVSTANIKQLAGCPSPAPFCGLPDAIPAQAVPTSIAVGRDGYIYVGELKGFPAPTDESNIWRVSPTASWAVCGASPDCTKAFDGGFTSIIDLAFGPDGELYVAELDEGSWAAVEIFRTPTGGTINACDVASGTCREVASEIPILTAISFAKNGTLWATRNSLVPGAVEVVTIEDAAAAAAPLGGVSLHRGPGNRANGATN